MEPTKNPDLAMGIGSIVYALVKLDGRLQLAEMQMVKELLACEPHGDLALQAFFLREDYGESAQEAYAFGLRRFKANRGNIDKITKKRYVHVLQKVAEAHDDVSNKERNLIRDFRRELRRL